MKYKKVLPTLFMSIFSLISLSAILWAGEPGEPGKTITSAIDKGLAILKDPSLQGEKMVQERRLKLWQELSPLFHFEEMAKRALSQHWKKCSPEEKQEFVELFTNILKDTYIGKTDTYSGEKIIYLSERQENDTATVQTKFITKENEIAVDYRLLSNQGKWKIYDVIIEGVSLVNNYRSQFHNILLKASYAELVQRLRERKVVSQK